MDNDAWGTAKTIIGVAAAGSTGTVGWMSMDEIFAGSGGFGAQLDSSSASSGESSSGSSEGIGGTTSAVSEENATAGTTALVGAAGIAGLVTSSVPSLSGEEVFRGAINGEPFRIWEDSSGGINVDHNTIPYSRVEKRAQQTYDILHGKAFGKHDFPAVIAETKESFDAVSALFGEKSSRGRIMDTLAVLELALQQDRNETNY